MVKRLRAGTVRPEVRTGRIVGYSFAYHEHELGTHVELAVGGDPEEALFFNAVLDDGEYSSVDALGVALADQYPIGIEAKIWRWPCWGPGGWEYHDPVPHPQGRLERAIAPTLGVLVGGSPLVFWRGLGRP